MSRKFVHCFLLALCATALMLGAVGCASNADNENASMRPWNAPKSWETGLPSAITEGR